MFWAPRLLTIAFLAFLSLFALDVFGTGRGFWWTLQAFLVHMIPMFVLAGVLALAWRWEWVGALVFGVAAAAYLLFPPPPVRHNRPLEQMQADPQSHAYIPATTASGAPSA